MKEVIRGLVEGRELTEEEMVSVATAMMDGNASEAEMASFLTALAIRGISAEQIAAFSAVMKERALHVSAPEGAIDMCGTGGARIKSYNISTISSIVVASCGVPVAKHGNRSYTSRSGSADLLESLGVRIEIPPLQAEEMLRRCNITFLFAPLYHPAMKHVSGVRKQLGFRTVFNVLGPLSNPAGVRRQLLGVYSHELARKVGSALSVLGSTRALVVHGSGMDEITPAGLTHAVELRNGNLEEYTIDGREYRDYGTSEWKPPPSPTPADSASFAKRLFEGRAEIGEQSIVLLNAGAALYVAGRCPTIEAGMEMALSAIEKGRAAETLSVFVKMSRGDASD